MWPHSEVPLIPVGKLTLNRNPQNYFKETEQAAFSPSHTVPGIEPSNDKMLQGRLFSYPDTHRHRLGPNYDQLQINCPYRAKIHNNIQDGLMTNSGPSRVNFEPSLSADVPVAKAEQTSMQAVTGKIGHFNYEHPNDDYAQPRDLFMKVFDQEMRDHTMDNLAGAMHKCRQEIIDKMIVLFTKVHEDYGNGIAERIAKLQGK